MESAPVEGIVKGKAEQQGESHQLGQGPGHERLRQQIRRAEECRIAKRDEAADNQNEPEDRRHRTVGAVETLVTVVGHHGQ